MGDNEPLENGEAGAVEPGCGVLELHPNGYGFLRNPKTNYLRERTDPFVPGTMKAITLLKSFLSHAQGMALVVDEHGGLEGIVTLSDLVEEIISDAVPLAEHGLYIEAIADCQLIVNGSARLEDINEMLGTELKITSHRAIVKRSAI